MKPIMTLHRPDAANMASPVKHLLSYVPRVLVILPENVKQEFSDIGKLSLDFLNQTRFVCNVDTKTGEIRVSNRALEVLWVTSYVAGIYYDIARRKGALRGSVVVDPAEYPELWKAMELYAWLINAWFDPTASQTWPEGFPQPTPDNPPDSWEAYANECTLYGVGYILLHEIAHVARGHGPSRGDAGWSIEQEKEADRQAIDWLFSDQPDPASRTRIKRGIAVGLALVSQVAGAMFTGKFASKDHPPEWQRLDQIVHYIEDDPAHPVFAFLSQVLPFFRTISGGLFHGKAYDDYLQAFDGFIDQLSRLPKPTA